MTTFFRTLHCLKGQSSFSGQHQEIPDDPEKFWSVDNPNFYMGQMTTPIFTWVKNAKFALNFRPHWLLRSPAFRNGAKIFLNFVSIDDSPIWHMFSLNLMQFGPCPSEKSCVGMEPSERRAEKIC